MNLAQTTTNTMPRKAQQRRPQGGTLNNQSPRSRSYSVGNVVAWLAGCAIVLSLALRASTPQDSPDRLVLRSKSSFSLQELSVDLENKGQVELRICESLDRFGACKNWKTSARRLSKQEYEALATLARRADLFGGRSDGAQMDFAYRSLEVQARRYFIAILVTTLNESFTEKGPRKDLLEKLMALEAELTPSVKPVSR